MNMKLPFKSPTTVTSAGTRSLISRASSATRASTSAPANSTSTRSSTIAASLTSPS